MIRFYNHLILVCNIYGNQPIKLYTGLQNEGWFDPWALLCALRRKATALGVTYIKGEVVGFLHEEMDCFSDGKKCKNKVIRYTIIYSI